VAFVLPVKLRVVWDWVIWRVTALPLTTPDMFAVVPQEAASPVKVTMPKTELLIWVKSAVS